MDATSKDCAFAAVVIPGMIGSNIFNNDDQFSEGLST
jgi:hypothetical protein